jgi:2-polyprenyl-6-methoxyphenol hydroxylase-like FAD-dependent oxidoreductase
MKSNLLDNKKIAVIGAGPVGLALAKLLQQTGADVKVYERDENANARIMGGTLDIHRDLGQKALEKAGLLDAFYKIARPTGERAANIDGHIVMEEFPDDEHLYDRPEIDRNDLRKLLLENLNSDTVVWDRKFLSLEKKNETYLLEFDGNVTESADLIIGANGGMCSLRQYVTDITPQYTGTVIIQGEVFRPDTECPNFKKICGQGNLMVMGEQKMLFSQTKANGALNYYISFKKPESWLKENGLNFRYKDGIVPFLYDLLANWHDSYKELFRATKDFTLLPMRKMPLDKPWQTNGNITLVGDAAHVMPPFAGIGVNIGLLDALYLSENLTGGQFDDIQQAIENYEANMFEYASKAQQDTTEAETGIHSDEDITDIIKDRR